MGRCGEAKLSNRRVFMVAHHSIVPSDELHASVSGCSSFPEQGKACRPSIMERSRRQPTVSANKANKLSALAALKAAREGGSKRVAEFEVKNEGALYDVLGDGDYAQLVAKRREQHGDFIVDDDGQGYADLGEEDDHWRKHSSGEDEEVDEAEEQEGSKAKKRKGAAKGDAKSRKKGPGQQSGTGSENIAKMFSKAAARAALNTTSRAVKPVAAEDSDALLADILGGIGPDINTAAPAAGRPTAGTAAAVGGQRASIGSTAAARSTMAARPGLARPAAAVGSATMPPPQKPHNANNPFASSRSRQPANAALKAVAGRNAVVVKAEQQLAAMDAGPDDAVQDHMDVDASFDPVDEMACSDHDGGHQQDNTAADEPMGARQDDAGSSPAAERAHVSDAAAAPASTKEEAAPGIGAVLQATNKAAASGWASICEAVDLDEVDDMGEMPLKQEAAVTAPSASVDATCGPTLQALPDGSVPFYFLDAYESPEGRPGEVFLFGKVPIETPRLRSKKVPTQAFASTCVVVKSFVRSVTVVPKPQVFEDTDSSIAELEASFAAANQKVQELLVAAMRNDAEAARLLASSSRNKLLASSSSATAPTKSGNATTESDHAAGEAAAAATAAAEKAAKEAAEKVAKEAAEKAEKAEQEAAQAKSCQEQAVQQRGEAETAKAKAAAAKLELIKLLHVKCADLKAELKQLLTRHGIKAFRMVPVKRTYAFELPDVPRGDQWCVKIRYSASESMLPFGLSGQLFVAMFGTNTTCLESLLIKRKLKGPCWSLLTAPQRVEYQDQVSWCKVELVLSSPKSLLCDAHQPAITSRLAPPLTVASLNLKTLINPNNHQHEVVAAGVVYLSDRVDIEAPMTLDQWNKAELLRNFCVVRKLDGGVWPPGFEAAVAAENASWRGKLNGGAMVLLQTSERSLLTSLLAKLQALDADVLVGHNISAFDLHVLLARMQTHKVPLWSRIGRLKRTSMPKLMGGGHAYGGGASAGVMSAVAGRVLCDTYLSARELVREVDYTLKTLSQQLLGESRGELNAADVPNAFNSSQALMQLVSHAQSDAWLALRLMFHLSVLPLTRALTALSGFQWSKSLQGARAQRIEMLLLHEFHARKYLLPDKVPFGNKDSKSGKKGGAAKDEEAVDVDMDQPPEDDEGAAAKQKTGSNKSKGPQYAGGLVLEPKKGLYDKMVIVLDFNSLYPSIIQEFNICFSTVERPKDGSLAALPQSAGPGRALAPLPTILQNLVQQRRQVKASMSSSRDAVQKQQLHIRQQALKLTANSMYGCLGFSSSRFYAKPLAELVTAQGRSILQSTVDLVQNTIGAEVIYGDTDSIMIHTGTTDLTVAQALGHKIKKEVNARYKLLEIDLDAIFRCMLLLKKKKYAAIKIEPMSNGRYQEVQEQKGLDIVRRDWCALSKDAGHAVLAEVLSCRPCEEVVAVILDKMREVHDAVMAGTVPLEKFIITKQLTKRPDEYADARSQPHVQVALRRRAAGKRDGVMPGEAVPYVICVQRSSSEAKPSGVTQAQQAGKAEPGGGCTNNPGTPQPAIAQQAAAHGSTTPAAAVNTAGTPAAAAAASDAAGTTVAGAAAAHVGSGGMGLAERAYHPEELVESGGQLMIDTEYYLGQQVHPVVSRLAAVLQGMDGARLAECLGLDPSRYKGSSNTASHMDSGASDMFGFSSMDDEEIYQSCEPLQLLAPNGGSSFPFRGALDVVLGKATPEQLLSPPDAVGDPQHTLTPQQLLNQVVLRARELVVQYHDAWLDADDELAQDVANNSANAQQPGQAGPGGFRDVMLQPSGESNKVPHPDSTRHAGVLLSRRMDERQLYLQLCHYQRLLNPELAVKQGLAQLKASNPKAVVTEVELRSRLAPVWPALRAASEAVDMLRLQSAYHWVDFGSLFNPVKRTVALGQA